MTRPSGSGPGLAVAVAILSVALSALPRVLLAADALPSTFRPFVWSDVLATYVERLDGTKVPYFETFFEYPPVVGYISGLLVRSLRDPTAYVVGWAVVCAVSAAAVAALLAREAGPRRALALWSLSPQLLLYGAINFDVLAVALLVSAIALSRAGRARWALAALAAGAVTKAFPALAAPPVVARIGRERGAAQAAIGLAIFAAAAGAIAAPSLLAPHPFTEGAAYVAGLTNFDSVWGLTLAALGGIGITGAEVIVATASGAGGIGMYLWALWRSRGSDLARSAALATIAILLWTRLYSPQYSLWLVPFFALGALPVRAFALLSLADVIVFATVYPLTLVRWDPTDPARSLLFGALAAGIVLRHVALIAAWRASGERTGYGRGAMPRVAPTA
jgi:hypothetical protein